MIIAGGCESSVKLLKKLDSESRKEALIFLFVLYVIVIIYCIYSQEKHLEGIILPGNVFNWICITGLAIFSVINYLCINWYVNANSIISRIVIAASSILWSAFLIPVCLVCALTLNSIRFNHYMVIKYYKIEENYGHTRTFVRDILPEYSRYSMIDLETNQTVNLYLLPKKKIEQHENYIAIKCYKGFLGWYKIKKPFSAYKLLPDKNPEQ